MVIFTHQLVIDLVYKQCDWSTMNLRPEITEKSQEIYLFRLVDSVGFFRVDTLDKEVK